MESPQKAEQIACCLLIITTFVYAAQKTSCHGLSPNTVLSCKGILFKPVCLLCNVSRSCKDVIWYVDGKMFAYKGFNTDDIHIGSVVVNGCPEHQQYSLMLEKPTTQNHNSLYHCQYKKENISMFLLRLKSDSVLSINTSLSANRILVLEDNGFPIHLQCVINLAVPPVALMWSLNNVLKGEKKFSSFSEEPMTFSYTQSFENLETDYVVTCSSKGEFIENKNVSLKIYLLLDDENLSGEEDNIIVTGDHLLTDLQTDEHRNSLNPYTFYILVGLITITLLVSSVFFISRRCNKKSLLNLDNANESGLSVRNASSERSLYEPYSQIERQIETGLSQEGGESRVIPTLKYVSIVTSCGIYEYWTGTFSMDVTTKSKCFAKSLSGQATLQEASQFQNLAKRMKCLKHSTFVVRLLCIKIDENPFSIVYELMEYGSLRDFVMSRYQQLPTSATEGEGPSLKTQIRELLAFAINVANAMIFVQSQDFRHPVLSLKKVLMTSQCCCKLYDIYPSDMAMAKIEEVRKKNHPPLAWMSPEIIFLSHYTPSSDIWSFSTLMWELFSLGEIPYAGEKEKEIEKNIRGGVLLTQPPTCPRAVYGTMLVAWKKDTANRPSFQDMLENLQGVISSIAKEEAEERVGSEQYFTLEEHQSDDYI